MSTPSKADDKPGRVVQFECQGSVGGYLFTFRTSGALPEVLAMAAQLARLGVRPVTPPVTWQTTPDGLPICPRHQVAMRARNKQNQTWHSHKVLTDGGEELYCRGYPGPDSPGWDVEPPR